MDRKLFNNIKKYSDSNPVRMHMPGHKGRNEKDFYSMDVTELSFNDNLIFPENVIKNLNESIKRVFNTNKSYILVNGSTGGMICSFLCMLEVNDKIIIPRNSHISVYYGIYMSEAEPIYYYPENIEKGMSEKEYLSAVRNNPDAKAILITYPTYYGYCVDIKGLCEKIKEINPNIIIIVDEAHGTHMYFSKEYPCSSLDTKADLIITSMHKTLAGLTQTSLLHVNSDAIDIKLMDKYYRMTTSTSPSFGFITSVEEAILQAKETGKEKLSELKNIYLKTKKNIEENTNFYFEEFGSESHDYLKMCINTENSKLDGYELSLILEKVYNIFVEASSENFCLLYLGINTTALDVKKTEEALIDIYEKGYGCDKKECKEYVNVSPEMICSIRQGIRGRGETIPLKDSLGRTVKDFIIPYPPGFPVLVPGECMDETILSWLEDKKEKQQVIGIYGGNVEVLKEE